MFAALTLRAAALVMVCMWAVSLAPGADAGTVSPSQEALAVSDIETLVGADLARLAELVRLAFHDAVGVSPNHKSDGCINLDNPDNAGLITIVGSLESLYTSRQANLEYGQMSRADFWALAGATAARVAALRSTKCAGSDCVPPMPLVYGRVDCATAPATTAMGSFPNAEGGMSTVMTLFRDEMGMTEREIVAVMGAHSLGDATPAESGGFRGPWTRQPNTLDNQFYVRLQDASWAQAERTVPNSNPPATVRQWDSTTVTPPLMMLNTDVCLARRISPDANGVATCPTNLHSCPAATTADSGVNTNAIVAEYAASNPVWAADFGPAFAHLYSQGYNITTDLVSAGQEVPNTVLPTNTTSSTSASSSSAAAAAAAPTLTALVALVAAAAVAMVAL